MNQIKPEYMRSLCRDWGLWVSCGKTWPCTGLGYPQSCQLDPPANTRALRRSEELAEAIKKIDKHKVRELFQPIQKSSHIKHGQSKIPGPLRADRQVEKLDRIIQQMEWPQRLVLMHTYAKAGKQRTTREVAPLIAASHTTVAQELAECIRFLIDRFTDYEKRA